MPSASGDRPFAPGTVLLIVSGVLFAVMATLAKGAAHRLPGTEVALFRFLVGCAACAIASSRYRFRTHNRLGLLLRGLFGGGAVLCYFLGIEHLPVGIATLLNYTSPVFTALFAALFLRERLTAGAIAALLVTTLGVVLVVGSSAPPGAIGFGPWELVGILGSMLSGAAAATIREVRKTDGSWEIVAAFCVAGAVVNAGPAIRGFVPPTAAEWELLVAVGVIALVAQLIMTYALRYVTATVGGILNQITPVGALALGWWLYDERVAGVALAGALITLLGVSWGAWKAATPSVAEEA